MYLATGISQKELTIGKAKDLVRETAYHLVRLQNDPDCPKDEAYSRSFGLYRLACGLLKTALPNGADEFIRSTYNPNT